MARKEEIYYDLFRQHYPFLVMQDGIDIDLPIKIFCSRIGQPLCECRNYMNTTTSDYCLETFLDDEIRFGRLTINTHRRYVKTKLPY